MKKTLLMIAVGTGVILMQLLPACRHEIPGDPCQSNPIQLTTTKTDATGTLFNGTIKQGAGSICFSSC